MEVNRRLNLVQPIQSGNGTIYIHSMPISREAWENYFLVLSKTYAAIFSEGLQIVSGPLVAAMLLKRVALLSGAWEGPEGVQRGLMPEIRRLTNVVMPNGAGWTSIPYETALARGMLNEDDAAEAEGAIVFFICASAVLRGQKGRGKLSILLGIMDSMWDAQTTSLDVTAFAASLQTSMPEDNSGVMVQSNTQTQAATIQAPDGTVSTLSLPI